MFRVLPKFLRGQLRQALHFTHAQIRAATSATDVIAERAWKLFLLLPRLHRSGGAARRRRSCGTIAGPSQPASAPGPAPRRTGLSPSPVRVHVKHFVFSTLLLLPTLCPVSGSYRAFETTTGVPAVVGARAARGQCWQLLAALRQTACPTSDASGQKTRRRAGPALCRTAFGPGLAPVAAPPGASAALGA